MYYSLLSGITDLGDSAITGSLAVSLIIYLFMTKQPRAALAVLSSLTLAVSFILVGKIILYSRCQPDPVMFDLRSPSGHTALSIVVYGMLAALVSSSQHGWRRLLPYVVVIPLIGLIGLSRLLLHYHTTSDVLIGFAVGLLSTFTGWALFMWERKAHHVWWPFVIVVMIILVAFYGMKLPAETLIDQFAQFVRHYIRMC